MIRIDESITSVISKPALAIVKCVADVDKSSNDLLDWFDEQIKSLAMQYKLEDVAKNIHISATRNAYKALGKDPLKYRNSAESMLRRIAKQNGLYKINNAVEINNLISVLSGYSLGAYDLAAVKGNIVWKRSPDGEKYCGIGKDLLNIEHLPALYDDDGVFGNPTSDSQRTMINVGKQKDLLYVIYSFDGTQELEKWSNAICDLLEKYANATDFEKQIIA